MRSNRAGRTNESNPLQITICEGFFFSPHGHKKRFFTADKTPTYRLLNADAPTPFGFSTPTDPFVSLHIPLCPGMWVVISPPQSGREGRPCPCLWLWRRAQERRTPHRVDLSLAEGFSGFLPLPVGFMRDGCGGWCWLVSDKARGGTAIRANPSACRMSFQ